MTSYMDIEEFMDVLDHASRSGDIPKSNNYDMLLQSITNLGKMIDKAETKGVEETQDLTAGLFSCMSDSDLLSHFMPVRGIDYDQNYYGNPEPLKKDGKIEEAGEIMLADKAMKLFVSKIVSEGEDKEREDTSAVNNLQIPRPIKKRKPRTYKYNPKPLQHKEMRSFVPDGLKDINYWDRRKRNNEAAKKSREERRKKELETLKSYEIMKNEYSQTKVENIRLKARNETLEKQVLELKKKLL